MVRSTVGRYGLAVLSVAVAAAFMLGWQRSGLEPPVAPFLAAILLTGWFAGGGPVVLTTVLSALVYLLLSPPNYVGVGGAPTLRVVWFLVFASTTAWYSAALRNVAQRLEQARGELEERVLARTAELRRSEEYLLAAQRMSHTGSWAWRVATGKFSWSEECARIFGRDLTPIDRPRLPQLWHPDDRERVERVLHDAQLEKRSYETHLRVVRPDGSIRYVRCAGRPVLDETGELVEFIGVIMDVTDLEEAAMEVRRAHEQAAEARFEAMLDERARVARELHDTLLQGFTGVGLKLVAVANRTDGPPEIVAALHDVIASAQATLENARSAIWDMRPLVSTGGDFVATMRAAAEEALRGTGLRLEFEVEGAAVPADPDIETAIFRVAQEAVANVVKHAAARTVRVALTYDRAGIGLTVTDDGCGFVVDPDFRAYSGHLGLLGIHERASQARGTLSVRSSPGQGTGIVLRVGYSGRRTGALPGSDG